MMLERNLILNTSRPLAEFNLQDRLRVRLRACANNEARRISLKREGSLTVLRGL